MDSDFGRSPFGYLLASHRLKWEGLVQFPRLNDMIWTLRFHQSGTKVFGLHIGLVAV